mmetsp:Transcript_6319/g.10551  ORF Transcript_6319/g.10551 Transcript_6319/m.10551 type:complete len:97 (+) Transcript_6319:38-328(+)
MYKDYHIKYYNVQDQMNCMGSMCIFPTKEITSKHFSSIYLILCSRGNVLAAQKYNVEVSVSLDNVVRVRSNHSTKPIISHRLASIAVASLVTNSSK